MPWWTKKGVEVGKAVVAIARTRGVVVDGRNPRRGRKEVEGRGWWIRVGFAGLSERNGERPGEG